MKAYVQKSVRKMYRMMMVMLALLASQTAMAASHSDAPLIKQDPQANLTDVYAFIGTKYNDPTQKMLNIIVHVRPFSEPGDGVIYDRFADDALYSIHIADPSTGRTVQRYNFQFSSVTGGLKNQNTILSYGLGTEAGAIMEVGDGRQNYVQTYTVTKVGPKTKRNGHPKEMGRLLGKGLLTPPPNLGPNTTPEYNDAAGFAISGAADVTELDAYTRQTVHELPSGEVVFAGPREDGFFSDIPGIFDLLDDRILGSDGLGQTGDGVDGFKGFNVLAYAIQIPVASLPSYAYTAPFSDFSKPLPAIGTANGVGVYASVSRSRVTLRSIKNGTIHRGGWVQVNRMGNPLFNEALVALRDKDRFNRTAPSGDKGFETYALNPELASLLNFRFNLGLVDQDRGDLAAVFIPDVLRVDTTTDPVPLAGMGDFHRLGFIGGDLTSGKSSGWPNGRRLGDDVIDIALTALASGPDYTTVTVVGDNVNGNDQDYHWVFPYSATPNAGTNNRKDS
ncbi:MAG: DUF4331 domain-containing protein [Desulfosarcinaceae bacterium]|nr:DUF4331 domain-containing protein [Desulfosarcinaceae bacterium]